MTFPKSKMLDDRAIKSFLISIARPVFHIHWPNFVHVYGQIFTSRKCFDYENNEFEDSDRVGKVLSLSGDFVLVV